MRLKKKYKIVIYGVALIIFIAASLHYVKLHMHKISYSDTASIEQGDLNALQKKRLMSLLPENARDITGFINTDGAYAHLRTNIARDEFSKWLKARWNYDLKKLIRRKPYPPDLMIPYGKELAKVYEGYLLENYHRADNSPSANYTKILYDTEHNTLYIMFDFVDISRLENVNNETVMLNYIQ